MPEIASAQPDGTLVANVRISGAYANWTLTFTIEPPDSPENFDIREWPDESLRTVAEHFMEAVDHYEVSRNLTELTSAR